jgi:hypothetical protein
MIFSRFAVDASEPETLRNSIKSVVTSNVNQILLGSEPLRAKMFEEQGLLNEDGPRTGAPAQLSK